MRGVFILETNKIYNMDCIEGMKRIPDKSIDMILCDLPYGTTACKWDVVISFMELWEQYENIITDKGCIALFGTEPFSSYLRCSNMKMYKYDWKWIKSKVGNFLNCKNSPLKKYEDIIIFSKETIASGSKRLMAYYPQGLVPLNKTKRNSHRAKTGTTTISERPTTKGGTIYTQEFTNYPNNILEYKSEDGLHPTQKPVPLLEYLIQTYTNAGEVVLDNCFGSGSTLVAAINTKRQYIGFELDPKYFNIAKQRMAEIERR